MKPTRLSVDLGPLKYLVIVIGLVVLYALLTSPSTQDMLIACSALILICCILFYVFHNYKKVVYDEEHLYITGRKVDKKTPLKNVTGISLTSERVNNRHLWEISYKDIDGKAGTVMILPRLSVFDHFQEKVKEKNSGLKVKSWSIG